MFSGNLLLSLFNESVHLNPVKVMFEDVVKGMTPAVTVVVVATIDMVAEGGAEEDSEHSITESFKVELAIAVNCCPPCPSVSSSTYRMATPFFKHFTRRHFYWINIIPTFHISLFISPTYTIHSLKDFRTTQMETTMSLFEQK